MRLLFAFVMLISTYLSFFFICFLMYEEQILLHVFINFILLLLTREFFSTPRRRYFFDQDIFCKNFFRWYKYFNEMNSLLRSICFTFYGLRAKIFGSNILTKRYLLDILFEAINRFDTNDRIKQLILILASESWTRRKLTDSRVIPRCNYTESS